MVDVVIVIPCYNEGDRLPAERFVSFLQQHRRVQFLFVDDGSGDNTLTVLRRLEDASDGRVFVHELESNRGKAEAVRLGCQIAFERRAEFVGYWDADLATPLEAICEFLDLLD